MHKTKNLRTTQICDNYFKRFIRPHLKGKNLLTLVPVHLADKGYIKQHQLTETMQKNSSFFIRWLSVYKSANKTGFVSVDCCWPPLSFIELRITMRYWFHFTFKINFHHFFLTNQKGKITKFYLTKCYLKKHVWYVSFDCTVSKYIRWTPYL